MFRFCVYRCLVLIFQTTFHAGLAVIAGGLLLPAWPNQVSTIAVVAVFVLIGVLLGVEFTHMWCYAQALNDRDATLGAEGVRPASKRIAVVRISAWKLFLDVATLGTLAIYGFVHQFKNGDVWLEPSKSLLWFVIAWVCHCLTSVRRVERAGELILFRTPVGLVEIPLRLLRRSKATPGGYFLRFRFTVGTIDTLNPTYPSSDIAEIQSALDIPLDADR